jgi:hypothetical protein
MSPRSSARTDGIPKDGCSAVSGSRGPQRVRNGCRLWSISPLNANGSDGWKAIVRIDSNSLTRKSVGSSPGAGPAGYAALGIREKRPSAAQRRYSNSGAELRSHRELPQPFSLPSLPEPADRPYYGDMPQSSRMV